MSEQAAEPSRPETSPYRRLVERTVIEALAVVSDVEAEASERQEAARLAALLIDGSMAPSSQMGTISGGGTENATLPALLLALRRSLDLDVVVRRLGRTALHLAPSESDMAATLIDMARIAHRSRHHATVFELVMATTAIDGVAVPEVLQRCAADHALQQGDKLRLVLTVVRWAERYGWTCELVRSAIRQSPELLRSRLLCDRTVLALHTAEPTATGWQVLASRMATAPAPPRVLVRLLRRSEPARSTLQQAIDATASQPLRDVLVGWFEGAKRGR
jgi:hypothetical protein